MDSFMFTQSTDVSVVIPCYQQGHFLAAAIESVLTQTLPAHEIIVIDDGSRDNTAAVAAKYSGVRYIRQDNSGSAQARNRGMGASTGTFLVFLDADDRLLSDALETGVNSLNAHPECAFVFGRCQYIDQNGSPVSVFQPPYREPDDYLAMLRICPIWHPAAVICRRSVFDIIKGFNTSLVACSDYDFYLRVTRRWPIHCHNELISEYRQHRAAKSADSAQMLNSTTRILRSQLPLIEGNTDYEEACHIGIRNFQSYYYRNSIRQLRSFLRTGRHWTHALRNVQVILRTGPRMLAGSARRRLNET
jgi:glycosyltransferase involved in cell wall biosynthesis